MAFSVISRTFGRLPGGPGGGLIERGVVSFEAADSTGELPINMRFVETLLLTPVTPAADTPPDTDQHAYVNETEKSGGFTVPSTGTVTIRQTGASPVAMKYFYLAIGH